MVFFGVDAASVKEGEEAKRRIAGKPRLAAERSWWPSGG